MRCAAGVDPSGKLVPDAHDQGKWRPEYRVCGAELPARNGADEVTCPACGEGYVRLDAMPDEEDR